MSDTEIKKHLRNVITFSRVGDDSTEIITDFSDDEVEMFKQLLGSPETDEYEIPAFENGFKKYDKGKPKWSMLPFAQVEQILRIVEFGAEKYGKDNWQTCKEPERYIDAAFRHLIAYASGNKKDSESGKSHLAHCACNLLFLMWMDDQETNEDKILEEAYCKKCSK